MEPLIAISDLFIEYPLSTRFLSTLMGRPQRKVHAVNGVSLGIPRGSILSLVGESGSGKTTMGKAVVRLHDPRYVRGSVRFEGAEVTSLAGEQLLDYRRKVQMIFQDPYQSLNPRHPIHKILTEPLRVHKLCGSEEEYRKRAVRALEEVGLMPTENYLDRFPHELSGGQRQRIAIAGALVLEPELIVADEPVSMLDVSIRSDLLRLMLRTRENHTLTYLFITHDISLAWVLSDFIAIMYLGTVVETGTADQIVHSPLHPYTQALIEIMPRLVPRKGIPRRILGGEVPNPVDIPAGCPFQNRCPERRPECAEGRPLLRAPRAGSAVMDAAGKADRDAAAGTAPGTPDGAAASPAVSHLVACHFR